MKCPHCGQNNSGWVQRCGRCGASIGQTAAPPDSDVNSTTRGVATHTVSENEVAHVDLPRTGYCQYCGVEGAHFELFQPEGFAVGGGRTIGLRARIYYVCGHDHFDNAVREEARAELKDQWFGVLRDRWFEVTDGAAEARLPRLEQERVIAQASRGEWKVIDRYCWFCGTHGAAFKSATRCSKCGKLQRLYLRECEAGDS